MVDPHGVSSRVFSLSNHVKPPSSLDSERHPGDRVAVDIVGLEIRGRDAGNAAGNVEFANSTPTPIVIVPGSAKLTPIVRILALACSVRLGVL